jgi:taurine transport system permease protein
MVGDPATTSGPAGRAGLAFLSLALFLGAWFLVTELEVWDPMIVPPPSAVWDRFGESISTKTTTTSSGMVITNDGLSGDFLWSHWWASVNRILRGLLWALVVGVPLGLALATNRWVRAIVEPWVNVLRSLPPLAYFSLLIIWFGIEDTSKIWLLFLAAVAPIALSIVSGARSIPRDRLLAAQALGASRGQTVRHVVLPSVLPEFFNGLRLAVGFAWTTIVAAETTDGLPGIGGLAWVSKKFQQTDTVILCIITIAVTAVLLDLAIKAVERRLVPWRGLA